MVPISIGRNMKIHEYGKWTKIDVCIISVNHNRERWWWQRDLYKPGHLTKDEVLSEEWDIFDLSNRIEQLIQFICYANGIIFPVEQKMSPPVH